MTLSLGGAAGGAVGNNLGKTTTAVTALTKKPPAQASLIGMLAEANVKAPRPQGFYFLPFVSLSVPSSSSSRTIRTPRGRLDPDPGLVADNIGDPQDPDAAFANCRISSSAG